MARWTPVGTARRKGDGIEIAIPEGPFAGIYVIDRGDAPLLVYEGLTVEVWQRGLLCSSTPWVVGSATWSESGRMIFLRLPGSARHGAVQIVGRDLCAHYIRNDPAPVSVLVPPDPEPIEARPALVVV